MLSGSSALGLHVPPVAILIAMLLRLDFIALALAELASKVVQWGLAKATPRQC